MAILKEERLITGGLKKQMDAGSMRLILENQQRFLYQFPIESSIRETVSNARDSHNEREVAKAILSGNAIVEDYYDTSLEGEIYAASQFDESYYDLTHLGDDKVIQIRYDKRNQEFNRDLLTIKDHGVGLGGHRLRGYFNLAYSTKRTSKNPLGKFGLGAKAPLSMVDSFRMTSIYNGKMFVFDIYLDKIQSVVSRWNNDETENGYILFDGEEEEYPVYYYDTQQKNGVSIEIEIKKGLRTQVETVIKQQLMYFDDILFLMREEDGLEYEVKIAPKIYYKSKNFIISDNTFYTVPHLILGQEGSYINYGPVNFPQLELESRRGNIGIVADMGEVDILPNREGVVWGDKTRDTIKDKFKAAVDEAIELVKGQLKEDDILKWVVKNNAVWSSASNSYGAQSDLSIILSRLSNILNKEELKVPYQKDPSVKYGAPKGMIGKESSATWVRTQNVYRSNKYVKSLQREEINDWNSVNEMHSIYFSREKASNSRKDFYILEKIGGFMFFRIPVIEDEYWDDRYNTMIGELKIPSIDNADGTHTLDQAELDKQTDNVVKFLAKQRDDYKKSERFLELAATSSMYVDYDALVVPDTYRPNTSEDAEESDEAGGIPKERVDRAKERKLQGKVVFKEMEFFNAYWNDKIEARWKIKEMEAEELNSGSEVLVYGTQEDADELSMMMVAPMIGGNVGLNRLGTLEDDKYPRYNNQAFKKNKLSFGTPKLRIIKVSKQLAKKLDNFQHIKTFLLDTVTENGKLKVFTHEMIRQWYTATKILPILRKLRFLHNFKNISPWHANEWDELMNYVDKYGFQTFDRVTGYSDTQNRGISQLRDEYTETLEKIYNLQRWIDDNPDAKPDAVQQKATDFVGISAESAAAVEMDYIRRAEELLQWATPIMDFFNTVGYFVKEESLDSLITNETTFISEVLSYMQLKGVRTREL